MHAVLKLNMLVVLRVFMVSSSLINYKVPELYRRIPIGNTRSESTPTSRLSASSLLDLKRLISACNA
jgi:hypothetical protein